LSATKILRYDRNTMTEKGCLNKYYTGSDSKEVNLVTPQFLVGQAVA
jgi:hypothetical protein